jgi:hypothetical protein
MDPEVRRGLEIRRTRVVCQEQGVPSDGEDNEERVEEVHGGGDAEARVPGSSLTQDDAGEENTSQNTTDTADIFDAICATKSGLEKAASTRALGRRKQAVSETFTHMAKKMTAYVRGKK